MFSIYEYIERAIKVHREFLRDRHYVVRDGEIVIVDEFTGRLAEGRKWRDGIASGRRGQGGASKSPSRPARPRGSPCRTSSCATSNWPA